MTSDINTAFMEWSWYLILDIIVSWNHYSLLSSVPIFGKGSNIRKFNIQIQSNLLLMVIVVCFMSELKLSVKRKLFKIFENLTFLLCFARFSSLRVFKRMSLIIFITHKILSFWSFWENKKNLIFITLGVIRTFEIQARGFLRKSCFFGILFLFDEGFKLSFWCYLGSNELWIFKIKV
jgi:hypothetical protein